MTKVPNEFPTLELDYRLAIVGEAPGAEEDQQGRPFMGQSGRLLQSVMSRVGLMRSACYIGNVCQVRPPNNKIENFPDDSIEIAEGLESLRNDLTSWKPNAVLLLGGTPLRFAGINHPPTAFRGSIFQSTAPTFLGLKCISTLHPAYVLRSYSELPLFEFDVQRAYDESRSAELRMVKRQFDVQLSAQQVIERLDAIRPGTSVSVDIEGGIPPTYPGITCIGISTDPTYAFTVAMCDYRLDERVSVARALGRVLLDPDIPKVLQNSLYDNFVLSWLWKCPIQNVAHDTMLGGWEIYPELPKGLGTQVSIYTKDPYYKFERKVDDWTTHKTYCCKDAALTLEISRRQQEILQGSARQHFEFNQSLLPALLYMELRGIRYDQESAKRELEETKVKQAEIQARIDSQAGGALNVNSPKQMTEGLYKRLGFEPQYKKEHGRKTDKLTADVEALLTLSRHYNEPIIFDILKWRQLDGQRKQLAISPDNDGRVRCSYNIVGTDTGRLSSSESPTGTGTNLQTITKDLRHLYTADPGYFFFQCDLAGADGWTVAAHCLDLGDDTMIEDYLAGIKPARVIAAMYRHGIKISNMPRAELKEFLANMQIEDWLYFACKRVQHGSNYDMGPNTMSAVILKDSWKLQGDPIYVPPKDCKDLQALYLNGRYKGIQMWQQRVKRMLETNKTITSASGHTRRFFGRATDLETIKAALSQEPQNNTTYATNLALRNLINDPENRTNEGEFWTEPLHQVHDAICGQFPIDRADWAIQSIRRYFNNPLTIANQTIVIPFEGAYGPSWGELPHKI